MLFFEKAEIIKFCIQCKLERREKGAFAKFWERIIKNIMV
jgi:hypothetical protein